MRNFSSRLLVPVGDGWLAAPAGGVELGELFVAATSAAVTGALSSPTLLACSATEIIHALKLTPNGWASH